MLGESLRLAKYDRFDSISHHQLSFLVGNCINISDMQERVLNEIEIIVYFTKINLF